MSNQISIADIERITRQPRHVINHAINRHGPEPRGRVGITRIWNESDLPSIKRSLELTASDSRSRRSVDEKRIDIEAKDREGA